MARRSFLPCAALGLRALVLAGLAFGRPAAALPAASLVTLGMPSDFATLAEQQDVVADIFFGGRQIGQFEIETTPGAVHILHPDRLVAAIPGVSDVAAVTAALSAPTLAANARFLCGANADSCEQPKPDVAAIVYDERRFRIDLIVNPRFLVVRPVASQVFLSPSTHALTLVDTVGAALAGGDGQSVSYNLRNRAILAEGDARLTSEASYSSGGNISMDTLAAELDRPDRRYAAGLFYAPGMDLVGRRRIVGASIASQFDTRTDRDQLTGTPLVVFLTQRSRVDLYTAGKLMSSHTYEAGNQTLDTASLPDGSYPVEIRIQEVGGGTRSEERFFTKSTNIPPPGHTVFFADAGVLAVDRPHRLLSITGTPLVTIGAARRVGTRFAFDATALATNSKGIVELGASLLSPAFQARAALLASSAGDYGALAQINSMGNGRFAYSIDARHVQSHDNKPLLPLDNYGTETLTAASIAQKNAAAVGGTFSQLVANLSYRIARAQVAVSGYFRNGPGQPISYAVGPSVHWAILQRTGLALSLDGSFAKTDRGQSAAFGLRLQVFGKRSSLVAAVGGQNGSNGNNKGIGPLAEVSGTIQRDHVLGGEASASASVQRSPDGTLLQGSVEQRGPDGYFAGSLVHRVDGGLSSTQYGLSLQTSLGVSAHGLTVGAREQQDSMIAVSLRGAAHAVPFEVLVNDSPQGKVRPGGRLVIAVSPYRRYKVRIRPIGGDLVAFDAQARMVDTYPGMVMPLVWRADPVLAMFGRLVRPDGSAIVDAEISAGGAISASDSRGYFQLQAPGDAVLTVRAGSAPACHVTLAASASKKGYTAIGDVVCRP